MHLPLRAKFALVAGTVAIVALGSSLFVLSYRLERQMAGRIGDLLVGAESTFNRWEEERQNHLSRQARIIARDPRFFASVAEGDPATTLPSARQFQQVAGSALFLVCDDKGRPLAHLGADGESTPFDWPVSVPPREEQLHHGDAFYLLQTRPVTVGPDTVGYVALGDQVDAGLATTVGQIAGVDVLFFEDTTLFGTSMPHETARAFLSNMKSGSPMTVDHRRPVRLTVDGERFLYRVGPMVGGGVGRYAVVLSLDDRLNPLIADMRGTLTVVGAIALALASLLSWFVARKITARVPKLVHAVEAVAHGDYSRTVVHHGHDELNALAQAVDRMRTALAAQMEAIRAANAEKIAAERLAVIGKMASTIIHDFKTPMQVIRSAVELSASEHVPAPKRNEYGAMVLRELDRMVEMAQELLAYARGDRRMARSDVRIDEYLAEAVAAWRQIAEKNGITVELHAAASGVIVAIDREKILRALNNIVSNAIEAMSSAGRITVGSAVEANAVRITIADTGPGIPDTIRAAIFEPFATFGKAHGTGLGLAMAKKTVDDHQGTIAVVSGPGTGTCFTIMLPLAGSHDDTALPTGTNTMEPTYAEVVS